MKIKELYRKTFVSVERRVGEVIFTSKRGKSYIMNHQQDCCESVNIESIEGDLKDLQGSPLLQADEETSNTDPVGYKRQWPPDSFKWTFYRFATIKGSVVIRWLGESNGYYSEDVSITEKAL